MAVFMGNTLVNGEPFSLIIIVTPFGIRQKTSGSEKFTAGHDHSLNTRVTLPVCE